MYSIRVLCCRAYYVVKARVGTERLAGLRGGSPSGYPPCPRLHRKMDWRRVSDFVHSVPYLRYYVTLSHMCIPGHYTLGHSETMVGIKCPMAGHSALVKSPTMVMGDLIDITVFY